MTEPTGVDNIDDEPGPGSDARKRLSLAEVEAVEVEEGCDKRERREDRDREEAGPRLPPGRAEDDIEEQEEARPISRTDEGCRERRLDRPGEIEVGLVGEREKLGPGDSDEDRGGGDQHTNRRVDAADICHQVAPSQARRLRDRIELPRRHRGTNVAANGMA